MVKTSHESFFENVWEIVRLVPYGRVTTYGAIAKYLGTSSSSRMVGWALNKSFNIVNDVPAHRVVNRFGMLTGKHYFGTSDLMKQLLEAEDIKIEDDIVVDFKAKFWDPAVNLSV